MSTRLILRSNLLWILCSFFLLPAVHGSLLLGDYIGSGDDPYKTDEVIGHSSLYTGWEYTVSAIPLLLGSGAHAASSNESSYLEEPLICNIDPAIDGSEIVKLVGNTLYVFDSNGQVQKNTAWPSPKNMISCTDVDGDSFGDVVGIVFQTGTPIFRVFGYDSGSDALAIKSENTLAGLGAAPYSDITCVEGAEFSDGEAVCAFQTSTTLLVYKYASTNFGLVDSLVLGSTTLTHVNAQPAILDMQDAFSLNASYENNYLILAGLDETFYTIHTDLSPGSEAFLSTDFEFMSTGKKIYDLKPMVNSYKGELSPSPDMTTHGNSTIVLAAPSSTEYSFTQFTIWPNLTLHREQNQTPGWFNNASRRIKFGLFDRDEDGDKDVLFTHFTQSGNTFTAFYGFNSFDAATFTIGTFGTSNAMQTFTQAGCSFASGIQYEAGVPITHDIDGDGDLEYFQGFAVTPGPCNRLENPASRTNVDSVTRDSLMYLPTNTFVVANFELNTTASVSSDTPHTSAIFGDTQQDGYFDMINGHIYYPNPNSITLNSPPNYDATELTPVPGRCITGSSCAVDNGTTLLYRIAATDANDASLFYAYDCDDRYTPGPSALTTFTDTVNFSCSYPVKGTFNTTVYVSDSATYGNFKKIALTVSDNGIICNFNGIPEPHLGETASNCAPDFDDSPTPEEQEAANNATLAAEFREDVLNETGIDSSSIGDVTVDDDNNIRTTGSLSSFADMLERLFQYILAFWMETLMIIILAALITLLGTQLGRRR